MKIKYQKQQKIYNLSKSETVNITKENEKYPRVINTTDTYFTPDETQLPNKGMKYSLHYE
jgi:hypothetical protein